MKIVLQCIVAFTLICISVWSIVEWDKSRKLVQIQEYKKEVIDRGLGLRCGRNFYPGYWTLEETKRDGFYWRELTGTGQVYKMEHQTLCAFVYTKD